jgi:organic radical activating enzyme
MTDETDPGFVEAVKHVQPLSEINSELDETELHREQSLNQQLADKPDYDPNGYLKVFSLYPTIQGEGPHIGRPAIFLRLYGCSLACPLCDTDYTSRSSLVNPMHLVQEIQQMTKVGSLIVITGGEPCRQNIVPTIKLLLNTGYRIQIETNGLHHVDGMPYSSPRLQICCSPKTPTINPVLARYVSYWKYVLDADHIDKDDGLPTSVLGMNVRPARPWINRPRSWTGPEVWVQPADELDESKNQKNIEAAVNSCFSFGYRVSLQLHKLLGLE